MKNKSLEKYKKMADELSKAGRFGDTRILHVNEAELAGLGSLVPSGKLPTNPKTGQPEAGILTAMLIGAVLGGASGGLTAKQKKIPLWQGILQGAGIGLATGAVTGGIGSALGSGGGAAAQAGVDAGSTALQETASQTLQQGIEQTAAEGLSSGARQVGTDLATEAGKQAVGDVVTETAKQTAGDAAKDALYAGVEEMVVTGNPASSTSFDPALLDTAADIAAGSPGGVPGSVGSPVPPTAPVEPGGIMDSFADNLSESFSREALKGYASNPVNYLAPVYANEVLLPYEEDKEDYLAGYSGPYDRSWTTGSGISWAARDGGEVKKRKDREEDEDFYSVRNRLNRIINVADRVINPRLPSRYNPLSDEEVQLKLRPSLNPRGMHRVGVTFPFAQGGLASLRRP